MNTVVQKWGNSLALRIPKYLAQKIELYDGAEVKISVENESLVITPQRKKTYNLDELVAEISKKNLHEEIEFGATEGRELL